MAAVRLELPQIYNLPLVGSTQYPSQNALLHAGVVIKQNPTRNVVHFSAVAPAKKMSHVQNNNAAAKKEILQMCVVYLLFGKWTPLWHFQFEK